MVDLYRDYAIQAEPDCKDLFDVNNNYVTATIAMEPYGKINSTGFDPATNGARPITNRVVKAQKQYNASWNGFKTSWASTIQKPSDRRVFRIDI